MKTRGGICVSHVRCSFLQKDSYSMRALPGVASYSRRMLVGVNTVLVFLFVVEMCLNVWSTTGYSVLFEVAQVIYSVDYNC